VFLWLSSLQTKPAGLGLDLWRAQGLALKGLITLRLLRVFRVKMMSMYNKLKLCCLADLCFCICYSFIVKETGEDDVLPLHSSALPRDLSLTGMGFDSTDIFVCFCFLNKSPKLEYPSVWISSV
jgi:hypothetical protein